MPMHPPATGIKLGASPLGKVFGQMQGNLDKAVPLDYLHISTSIISGNKTMTPAQEQASRKIINQAAKQMAQVQSFNTGQIVVQNNGYVLLEIHSPEIERIMKKMQADLRAIGLNAVDKTNPIHVTLRAGKPGSTIPPKELRMLQEQVKRPAMQALTNTHFSLANAQFGAVKFGTAHSSTSFIPGWSSTGMARSPVATTPPISTTPSISPVERGRARIAKIHHIETSAIHSRTFSSAHHHSDGKQQLIDNYTRNVGKIEEIQRDCASDKNISADEKRVLDKFCTDLIQDIQKGLSEINTAPNLITVQKILPKIETDIKIHIDNMKAQVTEIPVTTGFKGFVNKICSSLHYAPIFNISKSQIIEKMQSVKEQLHIVKDDEQDATSSLKYE